MLIGVKVCKLSLLHFIGLLHACVSVCTTQSSYSASQEKTYSKENEVAKLEKLMNFVREPLLEKAT